MKNRGKGKMRGGSGITGDDDFVVNLPMTSFSINTLNDHNTCYIYY